MPFEWKQQASSQGYNLQISLDNSFNSTVLDTLINDLVFLDKHSLNWNNNYWWRVRYFKEDNSFSDWLGVNTFGIANKKFSERNAEVFNDDLVDDGYYIFSGFGGTDMTQNATGIIDKNGNEIWNDGYFNFIMNHVNEHGNIYG